MEDIKLEIIDANHCKSFKQAILVVKIGSLHEGLADNVKDLENAEPVQDGPSRE